MGLGFFHSDGTFSNKYKTTEAVRKASWDRHKTSVKVTHVYQGRWRWGCKNKNGVGVLLTYSKSKRGNRCWGSICGEWVYPERQRCIGFFLDPTIMLPFIQNRNPPVRHNRNGLVADTPIYGAYSRATVLISDYHEFKRCKLFRSNQVTSAGYRSDNCRRAISPKTGNRIRMGASIPRFPAGLLHAPGKAYNPDTPPARTREYCFSARRRGYIRTDAQFRKCLCKTGASRAPGCY